MFRVQTFSIFFLLAFPANEVYWTDSWHPFWLHALSVVRSFSSSGIRPPSLLSSPPVPLGWSSPSSHRAVLPSVTCHRLSPWRHRPGLALPKNLCRFPIHAFVFLKLPLGCFLKFLIVGRHPHHLDVSATLVLAPPTWCQLSSQLTVFTLLVVSKPSAPTQPVSHVVLFSSTLSRLFPSCHWTPKSYLSSSQISPVPEGCPSLPLPDLLASATTLPVTSLPVCLLHHWLRSWPYSGCRSWQGRGGTLQDAGKQVGLRGSCGDSYVHFNSSFREI